MNVIAVGYNDDYENDKLTVGFKGAQSGLYNIKIRHRQVGIVDTIDLIVGSNVTDYNPKTGSIFGGTLLTITGTNFGLEFTDNPVQISYLDGVPSTDCIL